MANRGRSHPPGNRGPAPGRTIQAQRDFSIVGVGASAGGLDAFAGLLRALPSRPGVAIVLVQHLDPSRDSALAAIVARITALPVRVATEGLLVAPNHVYVIPPNTVMEIRRGRLRLVPRVRGPALPVDAFLRSLAADLGSRAIGVILSGSASDGVRGLEAIRAEGGITFAQTEASAGFTGMPHSAVASGCVDFILPPAEIARELARLGRTPYVEPDAAAPAARGGDDPAALGRIHSLLLANSGVDFSLYKPSTILRRIGRRMSLHRHATLQVYAEYLTRTATEQEALFRDLLIPVTAFFRDPAAFRTLENRVFSRMLRHRADEEPVRIWVPGCSTGEEAYSVAISLAETMARLRRTSPMLVLATDLSERSLEQARTAVYPETITQEVPADLLRRHFTRLPHGYEISGAIRKACVFARHNLAADTPYSRLDLIVCRNVLIYLEPALQKRIFGVLHYALRPGGFLMLGSSESAAAHPALFRPADRRQRIYIRRDAGPDVPLRPAAATPRSRSCPSPGRARWRSGAKRTPCARPTGCWRTGTPPPGSSSTATSKSCSSGVTRAPTSTRRPAARASTSCAWSGTACSLTCGAPSTRPGGRRPRSGARAPG